MKENIFFGVIFALLSLVGGLVVYNQDVTAAPPGRPVIPEAQPIIYDGASAFGDLPVSQFTPMAGWAFNYNINSDIVTTSTVTGTVAFDNNRARLATGAGAGQSATMQTKRVVRYLPGQGSLVRFTAIWEAGCVAGSEQIIGIGGPDDGLFFGCNGATFGIMRRQNGTDNWTALADWNRAVDTNTDNVIDITKGNVFQIKYQWLGYGAISFYIENPASGSLEIVHRIEYANANTLPSIYNPQLPIYAHVENVSNTSAITLYSPSAIGGIDGVGGVGDVEHPLTLSRTAVASDAAATAEEAIIVISNTTTYHGKTNRVAMHPRALSVAFDGTKPVTLRGYKNVTTSGASFAAYNVNTSVGHIDTSGTISGGTLVFAIQYGIDGSDVIDLEQFGVDLQPGENLAITVQSANATSTDLALTWQDLF